MPSTVFRRGNAYAARLTVGGVQRWLGTFESEEAARAAVRGARGTSDASSVTVQEWGEQWQMLFPGRRSAETQRHNAMMVAPFCRRYARRQLNSITPIEAQTWALQHAGSVRYLRMMWGKAVRMGVAPRNIWETVETPNAGVSTPQRRPPTHAELDALVAAARSRYGDHVADLLIFTAYSGLRLSEVADVQASDVSSDYRRVLVRGKRRAGEVAPRVRTALVLAEGRDALRRQTRDDGRVWRSIQRRPLTRKTVSTYFGLICKDAGLEDTGLTFHSLRRFYATFLRDAGADPRDIAMSLGHTDASGRPYPELVDRTYAHPNSDVALDRLEAAVG